ncbi:MAG: synthase subunit [Vampirovibrio sp.]|nr:synthase subunit [Vampirovibrio sp.]
MYLLVVQEGHESLSLMERIQNSNVVNILLVVFILGFLAKKFNLVGGIDAQRSKISTEILTIENQKKEALAQLEAAKSRTANLKSEVDEILSTARESAESLSAQILADAKAESAKIVENAKKRVELEQRASIKELEKRLLNDALLEARSELANTVTAQDQKRSVETFLDELSQLKGGRS